MPMRYPDLEQVLETLSTQFFHCQPDEIKHKNQKGGYSGVSNLKLDFSGKSYLLRLFPDNSDFSLIQKELLLTEKAGEAKIGPTLYYKESNNHFALIDYIEGEVLSIDALNDDKIFHQLLDKLQIVHSLSVKAVSPVIEILTYQKKFIEQLNNKEVWAQFFKSDFELEKKILESNQAQHHTFVHDDLNNFNIMIDKQNQLWFIDWANAGIGSPYSDYAMLSLYLNDDKQKAMLAYVEKQHSKILRPELLMAFIMMRRLLLTTWSLAHAQKYAPELTIEPQILSDETERKDFFCFFSESRLIEPNVTYETSDEFLSLTPTFYQGYLNLRDKVRDFKL